MGLGGHRREEDQALAVGETMTLPRGTGLRALFFGGASLGKTL